MDLTNALIDTLADDIRGPILDLSRAVAAVGPALLEDDKQLARPILHLVTARAARVREILQAHAGLVSQQNLDARVGGHCILSLLLKGAMAQPFDARKLCLDFARAAGNDVPET